MPVTQVLMAVGSWSLNLAPTTPRSIVDVLSSGYFGHLAISTGRHDPRVEGDSLFSSARYVGVLTGGTFNSAVSGNGPQLSGDGMATWLATPSSVGDIIEIPLSYTAATFATVINALLPSAVHAGTIHSIGAATYTGAFVWTDRRTALTNFCGLMSTGALATQTVEWRANNDGTMDAGHVSDLYVTSPATAIVARDSGVDMILRALPGVTQLVEDVKDYTTRVVVLASGSGASTAVGAANIADVGGTNPYVDRWGSPVKMTRMVSASSVSSYNATSAAQSALLPYTLPRDQVKLTSQEYDITGELAVGDYTYVYDPDSGIIDTTQEVMVRGQRINPALLRVIELDWPVTMGMTVAYRDKNGVWYDLTDYVIWDTGDTTVVVGGYNRSLVSTSEPVGPRPIPDTTIPGVPVFGAFSTTVYQGASDGRTKAQILANWSTPANTDGTTMTDLDHYEVQYRPDLGVFAINPSYNQLQTAGYTYNALNALGGSYKALIPQAVSTWKVTFVGGGTNQLLIQELTPGVNYDFQIRAVDTAQPPNYGAWSATTTTQAQYDTVPPATPDAPTVATNMASVQVTWDCGQAGGGTFNQAVDLHHVEIHGSYDPLFLPSNATKLGNLPANIGNITGQIPVVGSFTIPPGQPPAQSMYIKLIAVDEAGNKSQPSAAAGSTATLWSNAYITDLSVSKLTAGTITASIILGGVIETASAGQRVAMDSNGLHGYDPSGTMIFNLSSSSSVVTIGGNDTGHTITVDNSDFAYPTVLFNLAGVPSPAFINAVAFSGTSSGAGLGLNSGQYASALDATTVAQRVYMQGPFGIQTAVIDTNQAQHGGGLVVADQQASLDLQLHGSEIGGFDLAYDGAHSDATIGIQGYFANVTQPVRAGLSGVYFNGMSSGTAGGSFGYGTTMYSTTYPIVAYSCGTTGAVGGNVNAVTTSGFSYALSGASPAGWSIFYLSVRTR